MRTTPTRLNGEKLTHAELTALLEQLFHRLNPSQTTHLLRPIMPDAVARLVEGTWLAGKPE